MKVVKENSVEKKFTDVESGTIKITDDNGRRRIRFTSTDTEDMIRALNCFGKPGFTHDATSRAAKIISSVNSVQRKLQSLSDANFRKNGVKLEGKIKVFYPSDEGFKPEEHLAKYEDFKKEVDRIEAMEHEFVFTPLKYDNMFAKHVIERQEVPVSALELSYLLDFHFIEE